MTLVESLSILFRLHFPAAGRCAKEVLSESAVASI